MNESDERFIVADDAGLRIEKLYKVLLLRHACMSLHVYTYSRSTRSIMAYYLYMHVCV
jgi:hypothetical protein